MKNINVIDSNIYVLILFILSLPAVSGLLILLFGKKYKNHVSWASSIINFTPIFVFCYLLFFLQELPVQFDFNWFTIGQSSVKFSFYLDFTQGILILAIFIIYFFVHIFSIQYMWHDRGYNKFFGVLGVFVFSMNFMIVSSNLLVIFIFWELMGFVSYLLISHWNNKESASKASQQVFLINRIGDLGFIVGLVICWATYYTFDLENIMVQLNNSVTIFSNSNHRFLEYALLFAVISKSAQFPFYVWLPKAMEAPTPVSALIHAATMVVAGVYLVFKLFFLFSQSTLLLLTIIGAMTSMVASFVAITQVDIKKVLAYSTISQLGFMVVALGIGTSQLAIFHLLTHAFFKTGLFLAAGSIIFSLQKANYESQISAQNMLFMGGLKNKLPFTFIAYLVCGLSMVGIPFFSGFLSKDLILGELVNQTVSKGGYFWIITSMMFLSVCFTATYVFRSVYLIFYGNYKGQNFRYINENSVFSVVLTILTFFSFWFLWSSNPLHLSSSWLTRNLNLLGGVCADNYLIFITIICVFIGFFFSYYFIKMERKIGSENQLNNQIISLVRNNFHLNTVYNKILVKPLLFISSSFLIFENKLMEKITDSFGITVIVFSKIVGWADKNILDGGIILLMKSLKNIGFITKSISTKQAQTLIVFSLIGIFILILLNL